MSEEHNDSVEECEQEGLSGRGDAESEEGSEGGSEGLEEATPEELLAIGKKCLAACDPTGAVDHFQEACSILASIHGQVHKELAEPYYLYGLALLELSREKSAMFGKGLPVPADAEGTGPSSTGEPGGGGGSTSADNASVENPSAPAEEEESDLKLSWEVLELARLICQREPDDRHKLKLADVNLALGEVGMESDQYEQAISDLQSSLRLREFVLEPTDRRIAEVHFNLGLAYTLARQVEEAITAYSNSRELLSQRRESLKTQLQGEDGASVEGLQREIGELDGLIPDIEAKIADVEDLKKVLEEKAKQGDEPEESIGFGALEQQADGQGSLGFDAPNQQLASVTPASDIAHLIRKRKVVASEAIDEQPKRVCAEGVLAPGNGVQDADSTPCLSVPPPTSEQ